MTSVRSDLSAALNDAGYTVGFESTTGNAWQVRASKGANTITIVRQTDAPELTDDLWILCRHDDPIDYSSAEVLVSIIERFKCIEYFTICEQSSHLYAGVKGARDAENCPRNL